MVTGADKFIVLIYIMKLFYFYSLLTNWITGMAS